MKHLFNGRIERFRTFAKTHKRLVVAAVIAAALFSLMPALLIAGNQAVVLVDSTLFCTKTCHTVHTVESATILKSGHPQVACASCHVGTGVTNLIKSKIKGLSEILPTITGNYERPIPALVQNRIPTSATCQTCHSPTAFSGDFPLIKTTFDTNSSNTRSTSTLVLKLNGGPPSTSGGIHWHTTSRVWYVATDSEQNNIAWVAVESPSGEISQYVNPDLTRQVSTAQIQSDARLMDCIDCHNRVAHPVRSAEELVDIALADGSIDATLPFIKLVAVNALSAQNATPKQANEKIDQIRAYYQTNYPAVYQTKGRAITDAIAQIKDIANAAILPDGTGPNTYPDNTLHNAPDVYGTVGFTTISQQGDMQGCFRCHGTLVKVSTIEGTPVPWDSQAKTPALKQAVGSLDLTMDFHALRQDGSALGENLSPSATAPSIDTVRSLPSLASAGRLSIRTASLSGAAGATTPVASNAAATSPDKLPSQNPNVLDADCNLCHYTPSATLSTAGPHALPLAPIVPHPVQGLDNCLVCHSSTGPKPFKNSHNWATNGACLACHQLSSDPKGMISEAPPKSPEIPHAVSNLDNCLVCHGPTGPKPFEIDHAWVTNETCDACHTKAAKPKPLPTVIPPESPEIPHSIEKLDNCLICHSPTGPKAMKPTHAWVTNQTCSACHQLSSNPEPIKVVAQEKVPPTTHLTSGLENCLVCHSPGGPKPFKEDHPWVTNDTCAACHSSAKELKTIQVPPVTDVPEVPHVTTGLGNCLACHGPLGPRPFVTTHPWVTNEVCSACHKQSKTPIGSTPPPALPPAPTVPHSISGLGSCSVCHSPGGAAPFPSNHYGRPDSFCMICHQSRVAAVPPSPLPVASAIPHPIAGLNNCSMCHKPGGPAPIPVDHAGRPDTFCQICHKQAAAPNPEVSIFSDAALTQPIANVHMGDIPQGASSVVTFYVKNTGNVSVLVYSANTVSPSIGNLTMTFDGAPEKTLAVGSVAKGIATFTAAISAPVGSSNFTVSVSCYDAAGPKPTPTPTPSPGPAPTPTPGVVSYGGAIQPLLSTQCTACHGTAGSAGISLNTYSGTAATVTPGDATTSLLYKSLIGSGVTKMGVPPFGNLTSTQIQSIVDWINQGALNN